MSYLAFVLIVALFVWLFVRSATARRRATAAERRETTEHVAWIRSMRDDQCEPIAYVLTEQGHAA